VVGAASVQQARVCFERMEGFLAHEALEGMVTPAIWNSASRARGEAPVAGDPFGRFAYPRAEQHLVLGRPAKAGLSA
jgi:hypothetical protein